MIDIPEFILPKNAQGETICAKCQRTTALCDCPSFDPIKPKTAPLRPLVRLDKSGRKGKTVTLVERLPRDEHFLKDLAKRIKIKTGSGGTFYLDGENGVIEIQGDQRKALERILQDDTLTS